MLPVAVDTDRGDQNGLGEYTNEDTTPIYDVQSYSEQ